MFRGFFGGNDDDESAAPMTSTQPSLYDQARAAVGLQPTMREEIINGVCPTLTFQQRLYGFCICFVVGVVISLSSMMSFSKMIAGNPAPFAIKYSLGNTIAICSTCFLMGPKTQLKRMSHPTRWIAALVYFVAIVATIVFCFTPPHSATLVIICIVVQFCAMFWYCLSYIPYGRRIVYSCCKSTMDM